MGFWLVFCSVLVVMHHYDLDRSWLHCELNQQDLSNSHHYEIVNLVMLRCFVCYENIRLLDTIVWHFLGRLSNQWGPNMSHVQCHLSLNCFVYVIQLMNFQHIVLLQPTLVAISLVVIVVFVPVHALLPVSLSPFPVNKLVNIKNSLFLLHNLYSSFFNVIRSSLPP